MWEPPNKYLHAHMTGDAPDYDADTFGLLLLKDGYTPDLGDSGIEFVADLVPGSNEVTGSNYARKTLSGVTVGLSAGVVTFDAADPSPFEQSVSGFGDAARACIYRDGADDAARRVVALYPFPGPTGNLGLDLEIRFAPDGVLALGQA